VLLDIHHLSDGNRCGVLRILSSYHRLILERRKLRCGLIRIATNSVIIAESVPMDALRIDLL